jgi:hypothetical protein
MSESVAGMFLRKMQDDRESSTARLIASMPTTEERLSFASSEYTIGAISAQIKEWEAKTPDGKHLYVTMQTPDGRYMDISTIYPKGYNAFIAEGFVENLPCMVAAHINQLELFFTYEESKGGRRVGFVLHATEPQSAAKQQPPETSQETV